MKLFHLETYNRFSCCIRAYHIRCVSKSTDETIDFIIVAHVIVQYWSYRCSSVIYSNILIYMI